MQADDNDDSMMGNMKELMIGAVVLLIGYCAFQFVNSPTSQLFGNTVNGAANTASFFTSSTWTFLLGLVLVGAGFVGYQLMKDTHEDRRAVAELKLYEIKKSIDDPNYRSLEERKAERAFALAQRTEMPLQAMDPSTDAIRRGSHNFDKLIREAELEGTDTWKNIDIMLEAALDSLNIHTKPAAPDQLTKDVLIDLSEKNEIDESKRVSYNELGKVYELFDDKDKMNTWNGVTSNILKKKIENDLLPTTGAVTIPAEELFKKSSLSFESVIRGADMGGDWGSFCSEKLKKMTNVVTKSKKMVSDLKPHELKNLLDVLKQGGNESEELGQQNEPAADVTKPDSIRPQEKIKAKPFSMFGR